MSTPKRKTIAKSLAIIAFVGLLVCLIIPIRKAQVDAESQYRDLYIYTQSARTFFTPTVLACNNLDTLAARTLANLRTMPSPLGAVDAAMRASGDVIGMAATLDRTVNSCFFDLNAAADPGQLGLVSAASDFHDAYTAYSSFVLSPRGDLNNYPKTVKKLQEDVAKTSSELHSLIFK
ncbi:MAG: hypothetical protein RSC43_04220 [Clostridia bacterium]